MTEAATRPPDSTTIPTIGRILHCYHPSWVGPRAAIVTAAWGNACCNATVFGDGANDCLVTRWLTSLTVFDALNDTQRGVLREINPKGAWLEWPPRA